MFTIDLFCFLSFYFNYFLSHLMGNVGNWALTCYNCTLKIEFYFVRRVSFVLINRNLVY